LGGWRFKVAGILWNVDEEREGVESTGVYRGVVKENMIDTVHRVKRPFIDVFIEELFFEDADYPLTYVPMVNMVLPLLEGQEVWVAFNQQNHRYPVLWKLVDKFSDETDFIKEQFNFVFKGEVVSMPSVEPTKTVFKVSDSMWVIATDSYCVMRYGDSCVLMSAGGVFTNADALNVVVNNLKMDILSGLDAKIEDLKWDIEKDLAIDVGGRVKINSSGCTINGVLEIK
jgi:hypothetical protein